MTSIVVCPIVEGHGEYEAARPLLQRVWTEIVSGQHAEVLRPIRVSRGKLLIEEKLRKAIELASGKLQQHPLEGARRLVLLLIDGEGDPCCVLGPRLLSVARSCARERISYSCVVADVMYETWFVAAAESLTAFLDLAADSTVPSEPERNRLGKAWIKKRIRSAKYSETIDQPAMTAVMDLHACRSRSASFDKLCRELERMLAPSPAPAE